MRALAKIAAVLVSTVLVPTAAFAQATITGTVRDTSGAVLPGVTVEASSPVLIEKVRSAVTDSSGLYRIVDLRFYRDIHQDHAWSGPCGLLERTSPSGR